MANIRLLIYNYSRALSKMMLGFASISNIAFFPSKIEWDLTNGPLRKLLLDTQVYGSVQWVLLEISWILYLH